MSSITTINPATGEKLAEYPGLDEAGLNTALQQTGDAQKQWRTTSIEHRASLLRNVAAILRDEVEDHALSLIHI